MPRHPAPLYRRGKYWLDHDRRADGSLRSPNLYVWWYDPDARRERSASTGTAAEDEAILALDRRYLADADEAPAWCHACGQPIAQAEAYLLTDAIGDYRLEWGDARVSGGDILVRLSHVLDFLQAQEDAGGRFGLATSCAAACTTAFVVAFRAWLQARPSQWRNKAGDVTVSRPRAPSSTETAIATLIAALNHAANANPPRSDKRPAYRPLPVKQVNRRRRSRIDVPVLAEMLAYAAEPAKRRGSLHAFLVGSICTIARPSSVVDLNVAPDRGQWHPGADVIDLNPAGRTQTKKHRPVLPILPALGSWLDAEWAVFQALPETERRRCSNCCGANSASGCWPRSYRNGRRTW